MSAEIALSPRKKPTQARSRVTVEAILTAAARILIERGYAGMTTVAVAERAGVSVGSLYQYFPGKDALVAALFERHMETAVEMMERATPPGADRSLEGEVDAQIGALLAAKLANPRLAIALKTIPARRGFPSLRPLLTRIERLIRTSLERHRDEVRFGDLDLAAFLLVSAVEGVVTAAAERRRELLEHGRLRAVLVRLVVSFLKAPARRAGG
jgi:AcrR family transcriptional regulator